MSRSSDGSQPEIYRFEPGAGAPNSELPLLIYRGVAHGDAISTKLATLFSHNGWTNGWRDTIFDYDHFHTTAHEVLGIAQGHARVRFGGEHGRAIELNTGDVIVIPAGIAHKRLSGSDDLLVIGGYAAGRDYDLCKPGEDSAAAATRKHIKDLPLPQSDPVGGVHGALIELWK